MKDYITKFISWSLYILISWSILLTLIFFSTTDIRNSEEDAKEIKYLKQLIQILETSNKAKKEQIKGLLWLVDECGEGRVLRPKLGLKKKDKQNVN